MNNKQNTFNPIKVIKSILEQEGMGLELDQSVPSNPTPQPVVISKIEDPIKKLIDQQIDLKNKTLETNSNLIISNLINRA